MMADEPVPEKRPGNTLNRRSGRVRLRPAQLVPVQLSETLCGLAPSGLSVIIKFPPNAVTLGGVQVIETEQVPDAGTDAPQVVVLILNVGAPELIFGAGLSVIATL